MSTNSGFSIAERLDVRTKIVLFIMIIAAGTIVKDYVWGSALFASVLVLTFAVGHAKLAASFAASYLAIMGVFFLTILMPAGSAGTLGSVALACRTCMPILLFAALFVSTTKIGDLTAALYALKLPRVIVIPLVIVVRFFPTLKYETTAVADAMRIRGLNPSARNFLKQPALMAESLIVPIMLRCAKTADELAAAAVARGIDRPGRKTSYNAPRFGVADALSLVFTIACCAILIAIKVNEGIGGVL